MVCSQVEIKKFQVVNLIAVLIFMGKSNFGFAVYGVCNTCRIPEIRAFSPELPKSIKT
jgi:hypothetical protein